MGLYVGQNYFSYSNFYEFRCLLAKEIGINNYEESKQYTEINDNIKYLLSFNEDVGYITAYQCGLIAPRLLSITEKWDKCRSRKLRSYREKAIQMAEDMICCSNNNERLNFD